MAKFKPITIAWDQADWETITQHNVSIIGPLGMKVVNLPCTQFDCSFQLTSTDLASIGSPIDAAVYAFDKDGDASESVEIKGYVLTPLAVPPPGNLRIF